MRLEMKIKPRTAAEDFCDLDQVRTLEARYLFLRLPQVSSEEEEVFDVGMKWQMLHLPAVTAPSLLHPHLSHYFFVSRIEGY